MLAVLLNTSGNDEDYDDDEEDDLHARQVVEHLRGRPGHLGAQACRQLLHVQTLLVNIITSCPNPGENLPNLLDYEILRQEWRQGMKIDSDKCDIFLISNSVCFSPFS